MKVVSEHLDKVYGANYLANKYNIPSQCTVQNWINLYTNGKEDVATSLIPEVYIVDHYTDNNLTHKKQQKTTGKLQ